MFQELAFRKNSDTGKKKTENVLALTFEKRPF